MKKKIMQKLTTCFLLLLVFILSVLLVSTLMTQNLTSGNTNVAEPPQETPNPLSSKLVARDILFSNINSKAKLITTEVGISHNMLYDDSYLGLDAFSKTQEITFYANGIFTVDLSEFTPDNVLINTDNRSITISIKEPMLDFVNLQPEQTVYSNVNRGFLRFGEIKMSAEDLNNIQLIAMENMKERLNSYEIRTKAREYTENELKNILKDITYIFLNFDITSDFVDYNIIIDFY